MKKSQRRRFFQKRRNMNHNAGKTGKGFTIIELVVIIVIISIIAAIAVPSIVAFVRHGQQVNRMNIARTLYLAAQGELVEMRINRTLVDFGTRVDDLSISTPPTGSITHADPDELRFIHFVTTNPAIPGSGDMVMELLQNVVIDPIVLTHAIVIEFNIETGVVLSVFYSDEVPVLAHNHAVTGSNISGSRPYDLATARERQQGYFGVESTGNLPGEPPEARARIFDGERGPLDVGVAGQRRTNVLYAEFLLDRNDFLNPDGTTRLTPRRQFTFQLVNAAGTPIFTEANINLLSPFNSTYPDPLAGPSATSALVARGASRVYFAGPEDPLDPESFFRFVWVIDYIEGNLFDIYTATGQPHSIVRRTAAFTGGIDHTVRAVVREAGPAGGEIARSPMSAHTLFAREITATTPRNLELTSARHLNNIRYAPATSRFVQTEDINMRPSVNVPPSDPPAPPTTVNDITNFRPIRIEHEATPATAVPFAGWYSSMYAEIREIEGEVGGYEQSNFQFIIENLQINLTPSSVITPAIISQYQNVGLFAEVANPPSPAAPTSIRGLALFNATITAPNATNVGTIAGHQLGGRITQSWSFANVAGSNLVDGERSTGGLVGRINSGGRLEHSFNAGFFNHHSHAVETPPGTPSVNGIGVVNAGRGFVGGLVGINEGTILGSFNNARVNIDNVGYANFVSTPHSDLVEFIHSPNVTPGGIAGINRGANGLISNTYATNQVGPGLNGVAHGIASGSDEGFRNNVFIGNQTGDGTNRRQITKEELSYPSLTHGLSASLPDAETNTIFVLSGTVYEPGIRNSYLEHYPYPIIRNNNPFARINVLNRASSWGWEDILSEVGASTIIYYELYDDDTWGFQSGSRQQNAPPLAAPRSDSIVRNEGYSIELEWNGTLGYTVRVFWEIEDGDETELIHETLFRIHPPENEGEPWNVTRETTTGIPSAPVSAGWIQPRRIPVDDGRWYRFIISNETWTNEVSPGIRNGIWDLATQAYPNLETLYFEIYPGSDIVDLSTATPLSEFEEGPMPINPLFAPRGEIPVADVDNYDFPIRSPRHIYNIGRFDHTLTLDYIQQLHIDFDIYRMGLSLPDNNPLNNFVYNTNVNRQEDLRVFNNRAVVAGEFTGTYTGTETLIGNLSITGTANNIGLFSINIGTIQNVTMRFDIPVDVAYIRGQSYVGAIAGTNQGTILNVSVQQTVDDPENPGSGPFGRYHPLIVSGGANVGGVVGRNYGNLTNAAVVSTSAVPAVQGTSFVGGIVGNVAGGTVDRIMYLAVAPRTGTGTALREHPFTHNVSGNDYVTANRLYLSGPSALWPSMTLNPLAAPPSIGQYNFSHREHGAFDTISLRNEAVNTGWTTPSVGWSPTQQADDVAARNAENDVFPYPFPEDTVEPAATLVDGSMMSGWPIAHTVVLEARGVVYYEVYEDGEVRVFTQVWRNPGNPDCLLTWPDGNLRATGVVVEAGYALNITGGSFPGNRNLHTFRNYGGEWIHQVIAGPDGEGQFFLDRSNLVVPYVGTLSILPYNVILNHMNSITNAATRRHDPAQPIVVWLSEDPGGGIPLPFAVFAINPYFAKATYPVRYSGTTITQEPWMPPELFVRTPWQLQQISRLTEAQSQRHIFTQELDLNFAYTRTGFNVPGTSPVRRVPASGDFRATATSEQFNMTSAVITDTTANIVTGTSANAFGGTFEGNGRTISNLTTISGTTANNKGIFNTISENGTVRDLILDNVRMQSGIDNGIVASTNNGTITDITIRNNSAASATGTGAVGGVVSQNNGTISRIITEGITIAGETGNVGGIAATNSGTISDVFMIGSRIIADGAGNAGGIAATNTSTIERAVFVSNAVNPPVTGSPQNTGGIAASNTGTINNVMYIAHAPYDGDRIFPVTGYATPGTPTNAFYLSGTYPTNFNTGEQSSGQPRTTHELTLYPFNFISGIWSRADNFWISDILSSGSYSYPLMRNDIGTITPPPGLQVTNRATHLVYFEDYVDESRGFLSNHEITGLTGLRDDLVITGTGYGIIVPEPGWYTIRAAHDPSARREFREAEQTEVSGIYFIELPINSGDRSYIEIIVNDLTIEHGGFVNTNFAEAIFDDAAAAETATLVIRTPEQMLNIDNTDVFLGRNFTMTRNIDFAADLGGSFGQLFDSAVTGIFTGTFNGGGHMISNLRIESAAADVGLFSINNGTISNLTLDFGAEGFISASGAESRAGAIAGRNRSTNAGNGIIRNVAVVSAQDVPPIAAAYAGGIAGENEENGTIESILYLALAPSDETSIFPIVRNYNDSTNNITNVHYLSEEFAIIAPDGTIRIPDFNFLREANVGVGFEFDDLPTADILGATYWEDISGVPPHYPFPSLSGNHPRAWPIGDPNRLATGLLEELEPDVLCDCNEENCEHCEPEADPEDPNADDEADDTDVEDDSQNNQPNDNEDQKKPEDPYEPEDPDDSDDSDDSNEPENSENQKEPM